jgi:hypothetical protein
MAQANHRWVQISFNGIPAGRYGKQAAVYGSSNSIEYRSNRGKTTDAIDAAKAPG